MSTLYRPVKITSAEQANALPMGTFVQLTILFDSWSRLLAPEDRTAYESDDVPFLALVPIEAEEEWTAMGEDHNGEPWIAYIGPGGIDGTRQEAEQYIGRHSGFLVHRDLTPWQEADQ